MDSFILGIGTAVPRHIFFQDEALKKTLEVFSLDPQQKEQVSKLYRNSGIDKRHVIIEDFKKPQSEWAFWGSGYPQSIPGMTQRNAVYKKESPILAHEAAQKAIEKWGGDVSSITHVISVSCTGVVIPGIEFSLISSLKLKRDVRRLGINFMGCFGAFKGLEIANALSKENSKNRVLLVCTELCSLHLQTHVDSDSLVANSIFADGAAAVMVGCDPLIEEKPLWQMIKHCSFGLEDSHEQMSWEASDHGFSMRLSNFVPLSIARHIRAFTESLIKPHVDNSECNWAIHPGGKAILQVIEKKLQLEKNQTQASWNTLANYGNMSSATFLFVLENLLEQHETKKWSAGIGFGPGLSIEGILLSAPS